MAVLALVVALVALIGAAMASADVSNPTGKTFAATAGQPFDGTVAQFTSTYDDLSNFSATIDWGDGTPTTAGRISSCASCPSFGYDVAGSHTYAGAGTFTVTVVIQSARDSTTGTATGTANVTDSSTPPPPPPPPPPPQPGAVVGTPGDDVLHGTAGKNSIYGLGGNDRILGARGNDILIGGPGKDVIKGGSGRDQIIAGHGRDTGVGGAGNDKLYDMDNLRDRFNGGDGRDVVFASTKKGLQAAKKVEAFKLVGSKAIAAGSLCHGCGGHTPFLMDADGSDAKSLEAPNNDAATGLLAHPSWSPNGVTIAFDKDGLIRTINSNGTGLKKLTPANESQDSSPAWSPDGTKIAFESGDQIWVMAKNGSGAVQLTDSPEGSHDPVWTPDGTRIWFSRLEVLAHSDPDDFELWSMNPDGSGQMQATDNDVHDFDPAWSPNGVHLAWTQTDHPGNGGWPWPGNVVIGSGGIASAALAEGYDPAFSANGQQIVFEEQWDPGPGANTHKWHKLQRVNLSGSGLTTLGYLNPFGADGGVTLDPSWRW